MDRPQGAGVRRAHEMPFGAAVAEGGVRFRLWAPGQSQIRLQIAGRPQPLAMQPLPDGWHEVTTAEAGPGTLYTFLLEDGSPVPDPASRHQPQDVRARAR